MLQDIKKSARFDRQNDIFERDTSQPLQLLVLFLVPTIRLHAATVTQCVPFVIRALGRRLTNERGLPGSKRAASRLFFCQYAANAATRIGDVADVAGNQVDVNVHACLAARLPDVDADVVAVG